MFLQAEYSPCSEYCIGFLGGLRVWLPFLEHICSGSKHLRQESDYLLMLKEVHSPLFSLFLLQIASQTIFITQKHFCYMKIWLQRNCWCKPAWLILPITYEVAMNSSRSSASSHALNAASAISASRTTFVFSFVVVVVPGALSLQLRLLRSESTSNGTTASKRSWVKQQAQIDVREGKACPIQM